MVKKILIHGGAGGIGSIAIQLAKNLGAHVTTTVSTDDKQFVQELGADEIIDYKTQTFEDIVHDYDAVFDTIGGGTYTRSFRVLSKGGIIVSMLEQQNSELMEKFGVRAVSQFTRVNRERLSARKLEWLNSLCDSVPHLLLLRYPDCNSRRPAESNPLNAVWRSGYFYDQSTSNTGLSKFCFATN